MIEQPLLQQFANQLGVTLSQQQLDQFDRYAQLLVEWNEKINLTAIVDPREIVIKHFADSISFLKAVSVPEGSSLIDIGTGAGFPSTPLAIVRPDLKVTQLDSLNKRVLFLQEVSDQLGLGIQTIHQREEDGGRDTVLREKFDFATARAVANMQTLSEYCLPYVKPGGYFVAMKGYEIEEELEQAKKAIRTLGGKTEAVEKFQLEDNSRAIIVVKKISQTPPKYPRNAGKIKKSPL